MTAERDIKAAILLAHGRGDVRLFNNPVGEGWTGRVMDGSAGLIVLAQPRRITYGLCSGSSDLIGWRTIVVTPDMVGQALAVFVALEVKSERERLGEGQPEFLAAVSAAGGIADVARSVADAGRVLGRG